LRRDWTRTWKETTESVIFQMGRSSAMEGSMKVRGWTGARGRGFAGYQQDAADATRLGGASPLTRRILLLGTLVLIGCNDRHLRGSVKASQDGGTYLAVADDNGGQCGPIKVDGAPWPHKLKVAAPIRPGTHTIECGTSLSFEIPPGVVFSFDYWGP